jgi:predicted Zn-dependent protease
MKRWVAVLAAAALLQAGVHAAELPDFGSPADAALSKSREAQIGRGVMLQLRNAGVVVDDPFLEEYLSTLGQRLATQVNNGDFNFNFFVVRDSRINAFALPGGYIGVNSGLVLASESESELAGVLAHEISHVTQRHIARAAYDNQRNSIMSMAAMLAALVLGAASDMSGDAMTGIVSASQAMAAQRQINFTRSNEHEADRVGITLLSGAGFDPYGMSSFFEKLGRRYGGSSQHVPELLRTHPVSSERVAEARDRARQLPTTTPTSSPTYTLTKARLIALTAATPDDAFAAFRDTVGSDAPEDRYGLALASMRMALHDNAEALFRGLVEDYPNTMAFRVGQAEAMTASGATEAALELYAEAIQLFPRNVPLTISYA